MSAEKSPPAPGKSMALLNRMMTVVLRSPLHGMVSKQVMLITFTGRKSGKAYTTPVSYLREGDEVTAFTHGKWWVNLRDGAPVTLRIKGVDHKGHAQATAEPKSEVADCLGHFLNAIRSDAKIYGVTFDPDGKPNHASVEKAAQTSIMIRIKLHA